MPQPERTYKHIDTTRSPTNGSVVQYFLGGDFSRMSPTYSPTSPSSPSPSFERMKSLDPEEDHGLYQKKSVLARVKEKARKFRNSLSKRRQDDETFTPSWGVSLEADEEEEDAEYLGAPMYESELAPEGYKENARQHPRADPVISEKHVLKTCAKSEVKQDQEKPISPVKSTETTPTLTPICPGPNITAETIAEKVTPINVKGSDVAHSIPTKTHVISTGIRSSQTSSIASPTSSVPSNLQHSPSSSAPSSEKNTSQKGTTVKDYLMSKLVPGDDEKNVSQPDQVTSEATNPSTSPDNAGVMEKMKEAVNSLLWNEEPSQQIGVKTPTTATSSSQTQEVDQETNRERVLQAN